MSFPTHNGNSSREDSLTSTSEIVLRNGLLAFLVFQKHVLQGSYICKGCDYIGIICSSSLGTVHCSCRNLMRSLYPSLSPVCDRPLESLEAEALVQGSVVAQQFLDTEEQIWSFFFFFLLYLLKIHRRIIEWLGLEVAQETIWGPRSHPTSKLALAASRDGAALGQCLTAF